MSNNYEVNGSSRAREIEATSIAQKFAAEAVMSTSTVEAKGKTIAELFPNDVLLQEETRTLSYWDSFSQYLPWNWWKNTPEAKETIPLTPVEKVIATTKPIERIPYLLPPEKIEANPLTGLNLKPAEAEFASQTLQYIMYRLQKEQMENHRFSSEVAGETMTKFSIINKERRNILEEIKEALLKDEWWVSKFTSAETAAKVASGLGTIAQGLVWTGMFAGVTVPVLGWAVTSILGTGAAVVGIAGGLMHGIATAGKTYVDQRLREEQSKETVYNFEQSSLRTTMDNLMERLSALMDKYSKLNNAQIKQLKSDSKLKSFILQRGG